MLLGRCPGGWWGALLAGVPRLLGSAQGSTPRPPVLFAGVMV